MILDKKRQFVRWTPINVHKMTRTTGHVREKKMPDSSLPDLYEPPLCRYGVAFCKAYEFLMHWSFTEMCSGFEAGSDLRPTDFCITQL